MRVLFVLSEWPGGLTPERLEAYEKARARLSALAGTEVETARYGAVEEPSADVLVLSGSADPWALHEAAGLDRFYETLRRFPGPVFGICAGLQMLVRAGGGTVGAAPRAVRGFVPVDVVDGSDLFAGLPRRFVAFASHEDEVTSLPDGFRLLARSDACAVEAVAATDRPWWGTQFHPEAWDERHPAGRAVVERFLALARASQTHRARR